MGLQTGAGASIAFSIAAPATPDAAGFAALTFTKVGQVEKLGTFGANFQKTEFQPLDGPKDKLKGSADYGSLTINYAHDQSDAGQNIVRTAAKNKTNTLYSALVTLQDGTKYYSRGRVFGAPITVDGADPVVMGTPVYEVCTEPVEVLPS